MGKGKTNSGVGVGERLLAWYDRSRRTLPWRAAPGEKPDPYAVWLSEVMLQQTTVAAVGAFYAKFLALWPRVEQLAAAPVEAVMQAWAGLGYYSRARNLHACAQSVVRDHGGRFPDSEADLLRLPGVGPYTAAAIAAIAFDRPAIVVDGNVERVIARLRAVETPLPAAKKEISALVAEIAPRARPGDFAQAMMDLGATICTPRNPACVLCPLRADCAASATGTQEDYPRKAAKKPRPLRRGAVFYLRRADGAVLTRTRPPRGLLGGMEEFFGTDWRGERAADWAARPPAGDDAPPPHARSDWRHAGEIEHVFTHFALKLAVFVAEAPRGVPAPEGGRWLDESQMRAAALPSVMRKAERAALGFLAVSGLSGEQNGS
ncbi:A/G-specific adenine glycosylase [Rhodoblastus sp. 17X3]|uniref:A/G-specific adenine glycosylase n=1 Tax=Rhodoblastus sp. 17X3 TaxID=3047026 RepID=UPI0024B677AE|nr:A/G-specific adenine glycosylase [Rhodoblastus sp. 17X3]MDI9849216.1 A/G-specific adenine glycosylase [Rhodoblastus sp. 17X3]